MRNLKKILALVLALMMVLSVMVFASAANYDDYSDKDQVSPEYAEAVEVLTGMDIVWGVGDNNFAPKDNVARADVATLLYRIVTTDVDGNQVGIYKDYGMFDDVLETNWFAGYVNYAANNELVVGVGDGKFNPKGNVTGYEWITMLLRAIGYDQNNEISGSDWKITAAGLAQKAGILDGFNQSTLNSALTREQVVYLLFNAINVPQVTYTPALGYETDDLFGNVNESIGEENFGLDSRAGADTWGRPGVEWYDSRLAANNVYAFVEEEPVITYYTAVTECDLADDIGLSRNKQYTLYTNGEPNDTQYMVQPLDTVQKIGAEGTVTEVYEDVIVTIDTFLAKVVDVDDATYDVNDHLRTESRIELVVYTAGTADEAHGEYVYQTNGGTNYTYSVGDMVLVNAYTTNTEQTNGSVTVNHIAPVVNLTTTAVKATKLVILGTAPAVSGTQTYIWANASRHTVNGTDYDDAKWLKLDQAGTSTASHTWYFDGRDNLIGVTDEVTQYSYGVIERIQWRNDTILENGYATALIRYMDGNTAQVTVSSIDGQTLTYNTATNSPAADFSNGVISTSLAENAQYCGQDLYRIYTSSTGTVSLEQVFTDGDDNDHNNVSGTVTIGELNELTQATIRTGRATISGQKATGSSSTTADSINVNSDTVFLVRTGSYLTGYTFTVVEGYNNIGNYTSGTAHVDYVNLDGDTYADYVFVTGTPDSANTSGLIYLTSDEVKAVTVNSDIAYYELQGYIDGVPGTIYVANLNDPQGSALIDLLVPSFNNPTSTVSYVNRLFAVDFTNGVITNVCNGNQPLSVYVADVDDRFVNQGTDYDGLSLAAWYHGTGAATWNGTVLSVGSNLYNTTDATIVGDPLTADMSDKEIYVIYDPTNPVNNAYVAEYIYIADPADREQGSGVTTPTDAGLRLTRTGNNFTAVLTQGTETISGATVYIQKSVDGLNWETQAMTYTPGSATGSSWTYTAALTFTNSGTYYVRAYAANGNGNLLAITTSMTIVP